MSQPIQKTALSSGAGVCLGNKITARDIPRRLTAMEEPAITSPSMRAVAPIPASGKSRGFILIGRRAETPEEVRRTALAIQPRLRARELRLTPTLNDGASRPGDSALPRPPARLDRAVGTESGNGATGRKSGENDRRAALLAPCMDDAVLTTDRSGRITYMNPAAQALTGWAQECASQRPVGDVFCTLEEETRQIAGNPAREALRLGEAIGFRGPRILCGRDGRETSIVDSGSPIKDRRGRTIGAVLIFRDITLERQEQRALREAQCALAHVCRVNMMGELAASIAHEVNQPLAGVATNGQACLRWLSGVSGDSVALEEIRAAIKRIIRDGQRAGDIVARTRTLFRKTDPTIEQLDLNKTIQDILALLRSELSTHEITLRLQLAPDEPSVPGDAVLIQQVIVNLIMNAIQAMDAIEPSARELVIRTSSVAGRDRVCVEVQDSGVGLAPERSEEIFRSFHTTKADGMGMGLSISRAIVENHGGRLRVVPHKGPGAIFQFTLPRSERQPGFTSPGNRGPAAGTRQ